MSLPQQVRLVFLVDITDKDVSSTENFTRAIENYPAWSLLLVTPGQYKQIFEWKNYHLQRYVSPNVLGLSPDDSYLTVDGDNGKPYMIVRAYEAEQLRASTTI